MFELTKLISAIIMPPFNIMILLLFALLCWIFNCYKTAIFSALLGFSILYLLSTPYMQQKLEDSLVVEDKLTIEEYRNAQAIVVLGGGLRDNTELYNNITVPGVVLERMRYAAYLHKETDLPILITGASPNGNSEAKVMSQEFFSFFGIKTKWLEENAVNTIQNATFSKDILARENINKIILVTNQWHMQRSKLLFEREGFTVYPASVGSGITPQTYGLNFMHFVPQAGALAANSQLLKEWIGYWKDKHF